MRTTESLYAFSRKIAGVMDLYDLLWIVVTHLARLLGAEVVIWLSSAEAHPDLVRLQSAGRSPEGY